jgi:peroxiredoxin
MIREKRRLGIFPGCFMLIVGLVLITGPGCGKPEAANDQVSDGRPAVDGAAGASQATDARPVPVAVAAAHVAKPVAEQPPPPPTIPTVSLSKELRATCRVQVGDAMPEGDLAAVDGKSQSLAKLYGKKLTVVYFWTAENPYSLGEVEDQNDEVAKVYGGKGVQVIGIDLGDKAEKVRELIESVGVKYPILLDTGGAYFKKLASEKMLRTYLLDAHGKILWFDTEYSRATRRDLLQAIDAALSKR